jgi:hypothetical protein
MAAFAAVVGVVAVVGAVAAAGVEDWDKGQAVDRDQDSGLAVD